jgi:hypothetical protein
MFDSRIISARKCEDCCKHSNSESNLRTYEDIEVNDGDPRRPFALFN